MLFRISKDQCYCFSFDYGYLCELSTRCKDFTNLSMLHMKNLNFLNALLMALKHNQCMKYEYGKKMIKYFH